MSTDDLPPAGWTAAMKRMIVNLAARGLTRPCLLVAIGLDGSIVYGNVSRSGEFEVLLERYVTGELIPPLNIMSIDIDGKAWLSVLTADDLKTHH